MTIKERQEIAQGRGPNASSKEMTDDTTSRGQKANLRIFVGCTIKMRSVGAIGEAPQWEFYIVKKVTTKNQSIEVLPINMSNDRGGNLKCDEYYFQIMGPPSFKYQQKWISSRDCQLRTAEKIMFMYPVSEGKLSNILLSSSEIQQYTLIEAEPCLSRFDVECLLCFLAKRKVSLQVNIVDLFPINCLASFYPHRRDLQSVKELYVTILECLFKENEIEFEIDPFVVSHRFTDFPVGMLTVAPNLPLFIKRAFADLPTDWDPEVNETTLGMNYTVTIPEAGSEKTFEEFNRIGELIDWGRSVANTEMDNELGISCEVARSKDNSMCLLCYVVKHSIRRCDIGNQLSAVDVLTLEEGCNIVVDNIKTHCMKQVTEEEESELGEWGLLGHPIWGCYRIKMYVGPEGIPKIYDIQGIHAHYDAKLDNITSGISIGGLVNYGGQKVVLAGINVVTGLNQDVVIVFPRYSDSKKATEAFRTEMMILGAAGQKTSRVVKLHHADYSNGWAVLERLGGTLQEYLCRFKSNTSESRVEIMKVLLQSAKALSATHDMNIVHRDVKPANFLYYIVVDKLGVHKVKVKISDFGLAMFVSEESDIAESAAGGATGTVGTSSYKAPEVVRKLTYGKKADVYSFGILMYELVYRCRRRTEINDEFVCHPSYDDFDEFAASRPTPKLSGIYGEDIDNLITLCTKIQVTKRPTIKDVVEKLKRIRLQAPQERMANIRKVRK
jgi:hypothetical protein